MLYMNINLMPVFWLLLFSLITVAAVGAALVNRWWGALRSIPAQPTPPIVHSPPAQLTEALDKLQKAQGADRREALQQAVPLLRDYLNDPDSQGISGVKDN